MRRSDRVLNTVSGYLECYRCGGRYDFRKMLPADLEIAVAVIKAFGAQHRRCPKQASGERLRQEAEAKWAELKLEERQDEVWHHSHP